MFQQLAVAYMTVFGSDAIIVGTGSLLMYCVNG